MIVLEQAREIAIQEITKILGNPNSFGLIDSATIERSYGWVFFYQSRSYLGSGDELEMFAGNAPLIIARTDGAVTIAGTALPVEHYLAALEP